MARPRWMTDKLSVFRQLASLWRTWIVIFVPLLLAPLPICIPTREAKCGYGVLIMAIFWMTEALPMAVTSFLPVVLFPWLGVLGSKQLAMNYLKDTNLLFFGGLIVAVAVERWNLHKRIALRTLLIVGSQPKWLMFGFMIVTAFLSMWISNTATTAMMIPITAAVLGELAENRKRIQNKELAASSANGATGATRASFKKKKSGSFLQKHNKVDALELEGGEVIPNNNTDVDKDVERNEEQTEDKEAKKENGSFNINEIVDDDEFKNMAKGLTICVAYAANIGGTATLTGTGPNLVIKGNVDRLYGSEAGINFSSWFIYAFPNMLVSLFLAWCWLQIFFLGPSKQSVKDKIREFLCCGKKEVKYDDSVAQVIRREYTALGPMSFAEVAVLVHFITLALLWLTREPGFVPGWSVFFEPGYVTDASVAMTIAVLLFVCPSKKPNFLCFRKHGEASDPGPVPALLDWHTIHMKMGWSVLFLLGGGFALAEACEKSGLSDMIGHIFTSFLGFPVWILVLLLCTITATFTEITSNIATATIFLPILAKLAETMKINPLFLMIPTTISTSFAFMLPVATPPNAIVFAYGHMKIIDMVKAGVVMNIMCLLVVTMSINTWGAAVFKLHEFPAWADDSIPPANASLFSLSTAATNQFG